MVAGNHKIAPKYPAEIHHMLVKVRKSGAGTRVVSREKVPNVLSRWHTKRKIGARGSAHPSFGMTPDFSKKKKKIGMTPTQALGDLFARRRPPVCGNQSTQRDD